MKVGLLISIREKSKRFPGKVLKEIKGQTVTEHLIDRLNTASGFDKIIIATSDDPRDKVFGNIAKEKNTEIYFGDPEDKLLRYLQIANNYELDAVIIVDGDDILCFPEIVTRTCKILREKNYDVIFWKYLPLGAACSGLTKSALKEVMNIKAETDTEVWGGYFTNGDFNVRYEEPETELFKHPEIRLTLDYEEDFFFFNAIYDELYEENREFSSIDLMKLLIDKRPELNKINSEAQKKYEKNIKKATTVKFKE